MRRKNFKHGLTDLPEYRVWQTMRLRCSNPANKAYPNYGGRGIRVCDRWQDNFLAFLEDMGRKPSPQHEIDRTNNDGHYEPGNCRWVLRKENDRNRRSNHLLTYRGETKPLIAWCDELNLPAGTVSKRLQAGWSDEKALSTPVAPRRPFGSPAPERQLKRPHRSRISEERRERVIELIALGLTQEQVSTTMSISINSVGRIVQKHRTRTLPR